MRHSRAVGSDYRTPDDARWLTALGRSIANEAGQALAAQALEIDGIVSSPLVRTTQTAELVAHHLGYTGEIQTLGALRSEGSAQHAIEELQVLGFASVLAVTHEPIVGVMSDLITGRDIGGMGSGFVPAEIRAFEDEKLLWSWRA